MSFDVFNVVEREWKGGILAILQGHGFSFSSNTKDSLTLHSRTGHGMQKTISHKPAIALAP
jgi:hypothetical protein